MKKMISYFLIFNMILISKTTLAESTDSQNTPDMLYQKCGILPKFLNENTNYENIFECYKIFALQGNARAQANIGRMYLEGIGTSQNYVKGIEWLNRAAEQNDLNAELNLSIAYANGLGVKKSSEISIQWLEKAANNKELSSRNINVFQFAFHLVASIPEAGTEFFNWVQKYANQNNPAAQCVLGIEYELGLHVSQDSQKAYDLYTKAANQKYSHAYFFLGKMHWLGKDYASALLWFKEAAKHNDLSAEHYLAEMYFEGLGVNKDNHESFLWLKKSAEHGNPIAQYELGNYYEKGIGTVANKQKAFEWYKNSADMGYNIAQEKIRALQN